MVKVAIAILFCLLLFVNIAAAEEMQKLKIIKPEVKPIDAVKPFISLEQAKENSNSIGIKNNTLANSTKPEPKKEKVASNSVGSGMVSDGINLFGRSAVDGLYKSFDSNSAVNEKFGTTRGVLYTAITFVPNPYDDPRIKELFTNYNALAIFFVIIFIFGEWSNRRLASTKATSSVFGEKDLFTSKFWGGICMCFIALSANFIYLYTLKIIEALSQFAMSKVLDSIAPSPDNLILYAMMAVCDLTVFIFFMVRYFIIYAVAVLCTIIAVLYVPDFSRDFARKSIDHILRILFLQPVAIFFTSLGILTLTGLPIEMQPLGYIGLTVLIFLVCWYMLNW